MTMEVRYIVFEPDEVRGAVSTFVRKQGQAPNGVAAVDVAGPGDDPIVTVRPQGAPETGAIKLTAQYLIAALLLHCMDRRIPIPKDASKRVELSVNGLTLVMTTDRSVGAPSVSQHNVSYGEIANRATQAIGGVQEQLARALARAGYAEDQWAQAEERAKRAEAARGKSSALLTAVMLVPGLRGHIGRWLVRFQFPYSDGCI